MVGGMNKGKEGGEGQEGGEEVGGQRKAFLLHVEFTSPVHRLVVLEEAQIVSPFVSQVAVRLLCLSVGTGGDVWLHAVTVAASSLIHHVCHHGRSRCFVAQLLDLLQRGPMVTQALLPNL